MRTPNLVQQLRPLINRGYRRYCPVRRRRGSAGRCLRVITMEIWSFLLHQILIRFSKYFQILEVPIEFVRSFYFVMFPLILAYFILIVLFCFRIFNSLD